MNKTRKNNLSCVLLSVFAAAIVFVIFLAVDSVFPFGNNSILRNDATAQYVPLLNEFVQRIKDGESLMFSFSDGAGSNFYATICYYLVNPFNLIALFFNSHNIDKAFELIIFLQTLCISGSFSYYLIRKFKNNGFSIAAFSVLYTFCGFFMAYYYNGMWLNALILLPLIALGIEKIINGKSGVLYLISLTAAIITSFYMGYMLCIFSIIYFIIQLFCAPLYNKDKKAEVKEKSIGAVLVNFAGLSLFAGLMSAFVLLPTYCALQETSAKAVFTDSKMFFNFLDFMCFHLDGINIPPLVNTQGTLPNISCGMLTFCLLPMYFFAKNIRVNEKVSYAVLLIILVLSFQIPSINMAWHGFAAPSLLPYRFSYIYCFVIIQVAYKTYLHIKDVPVWAFAFPVVATAGAMIYTKFSTHENQYSNKMLIISGIAFLIFMFLLVLKKYEKLNKKVLSAMFLCAVVVETSIGQQQNFLGNDINLKETYPYISEMRLASSDIKVSERDSFYRMEPTSLPDEMAFPGQFYGVYSTTSFSSLNDSHFSVMQGSLGNQGNFQNSYTYVSQTAVYNALFGIRYVLDVNQIINENYMYYEKAGEYNQYPLYKNTASLPLGYMVKSDIADWSANGFAFTNQNYLWNSATGAGYPFSIVEPSGCDFTNAYGIGVDEIVGYADQKETDESEDEHGHHHLSMAELISIAGNMGGSYPFKVTDNDYSVDFSFVSDKDGEMYIIQEAASLGKMDIIRENGTVTTYTVGNNKEISKFLIDVGYCTAGETIHAKFYEGLVQAEDFNADAPNSDSVFVQAATLDEDIFKTGYNQILENGVLDMTEFNEDYIKGTVNAAKDGIMMMSMPQDAGWTILVDGQETEQLENDAHILMFNVSQGEHTIEMKFFPAGLKEGLFVSGASVLALILFTILMRLRKNRKDEPVEIAEEENLDADFVRNAELKSEKKDAENQNSDNAKE